MPSLIFADSLINMLYFAKKLLNNEKWWSLMI
jgi:hypothetical protein